MIAQILQEPWWLMTWITWLGLVNALSLAFLDHEEARWVLAAWIASFITMQILYELFGYTRILGLAHMIFWIPLVIYLYRRLLRMVGPTVYESWIRVLLATIGLSLVIDSVDVLRYMLGDRS